MQRKNRPSVMLILLTLLVSLFLLSVVSNMLTGYPEGQHEDAHTPTKQPGESKEKPPSTLLFKVSPVTSKLYWRVSAADYYTGFNWLRTTDDKLVEELPQFQDGNATEIFTVEIETSLQEILLPLPSTNSAFANVSFNPSEGLRFFADPVGNIYKILRMGQAERVTLVYKASWHEAEIDDRLISLDSVPEEILKKCLQLPDISGEVWRLAEDLQDPSYSILDQVLADLQYLRSNFVYDVDARQRLDDITQPQGSDVSSYIRQRKGICMDAATALSVILRIQKIPARISLGYTAGRIEGGKVLYYSTGGHAVTEVYLPPYGWVQFDATPPLEGVPLVKVFPFKKQISRGSGLFYLLSVTNRGKEKDHFKLFAESKQKWNVNVVPEELEIEASQTVDALLEASIPENATFSEKDVVTVTVVSLSDPDVAFSILAIIEVENVLYATTITTLRNIDRVIRGDAFWVNGTVLTASDERVDNMTIFVFLTRSRENEGEIFGKGYSQRGDFQIEIAVPYSMEIGDYKVIAISLGTTQYAPSNNHSIIKVLATTRIILGSEEEFVLGYGAIHGCLLWDDGNGFANAPISFEITSLATPSAVWKLQNQTLDDGSFRIETRFENPGVYEVTAMFSGSQSVLGSSATRVVQLKRGLPTIQILSENTAVRGEVFNIAGTIQSEAVEVWGELVTVTFDNELLGTIETGDNGTYTSSFLVDFEERLGSHILTVALTKGNVSAVQEITVKSKTRLTARVSEVSGGAFLVFSASLSDDHNLPIPDAKIVVDDYGLTWKTDNNGNLTFLLDTVKLWPGSLVLAARFEGSEFYLPATTEKEVALEPVISLPFLIPLVVPTLFVIGFVYAKHIVKKPQTFRQTETVEVVKGAVVKGELVFGPQEMQPLRIVLPDIEAPFPNVWGVKDRLRIEIELDKSVFEKAEGREVEVFIDEENVASLRLSQEERAEFSHVFIEKGEHKIRVILQRTPERQPWATEVKLRTVDYGEEIVRLYNEFLEKLASCGIHARNEMTAREIERLILRAGDFSPEAIRKVTNCFEKTEYSNHLATRKDYEIMFISLKELNVDVE